MVFLITVVTDGPAQVLIFLLRWPIAVTVILSRGLGCVDPRRQNGALRPGAAGAAIATISIVPILLVVPARSLGFDGLGTMRKHSSCLVGVERKGTLVPDVILDRF